MACSDLWAIDQRKCKEWQKEGFFSRLSSDEFTIVGIGRYHYEVYNYHDSRACSYKWSGILFQLDGMVGNGVVFVETLWSICALCASVIILCDIL
jgi:hypothetical protein